MKAFHEVRRYNDDFMVWHGAYRNMSYCAHWHDELELTYVRSGSASIHIGDRAFEAREGDLLLCAGGNIHYSDSQDPRNRLEFIVFSPRLIGQRSAFADWGQAHITAAQLHEAGLAPLVPDLFDRISQELGKRPPYYQEIIKSLLNTFWYSVKRAFPVQSSSTSAQTRRHDMAQNVQRLLSHIDNHYQEPLSLEQAAQLMNFSQCHFSRLFRQYTGMNFVTYVNMVRVEKSLERLRSSSGRVVDIAYACGFNNIRTFNRVFRQVTGRSPTEFLNSSQDSPYLLPFKPYKDSAGPVIENDSYVVIQDGKPLGPLPEPAAGSF
jgi:AraC-like DNA-binding protein/mannose-6-phosphate isomerase-like protein (cupin superfamily)